MGLIDKVNVEVNGSGNLLSTLSTYTTKVLKPNIIDGRNILTQAMISSKNTKYVIKYDYELVESVTVPKNCILEFDGGTLSNGTIIGQDTYINDVGGIGVETLFGEGITREGTWRMIEDGGSSSTYSVVFKPAGVYLKADEDGYIDSPVSNEVEVDIYKDGTKTTMRSVEVISYPAGTTALWNTVTGKLDVIASADDPADYEGTIVVKAWSTDGGSAIGEVSVVGLRKGAQGTADAAWYDVVMLPSQIRVMGDDAGFCNSPVVKKLDMKVYKDNVETGLRSVITVSAPDGVSVTDWVEDESAVKKITITADDPAEWEGDIVFDVVCTDGKVIKKTLPVVAVRQSLDLTEEHDDITVEQQAMARQNIGIDDEAIGAGEDSKKVFLKMNMVDGKNVLTQDMFYKDSNVAGSRGIDDGESANGRVPNTNKIFVVQHDYDLDGETIELPEGTTLEFGGGSISNGRLSGVVLNKDFHPEWFGAVGDGVHDDTSAIQQCIDLSNKYGGSVLLSRAVYKVTHIDLKTKTHLKGVGIGASIIKSEDAYEKGIINILRNSTQCKISDISIIGNKEQDGIYVDAAERIGGTEPIDYPMSYWLEENTGIENNMQSYRNLIIDNVYVGTCRYGMYFNNFCYRTTVTRCDIKRCVYGVYWPITDSSMHECYIERCDRDGLIVTGSNNNISNVKSIWNGQSAPYECYGMNLRGNRNRYSNLESQDNYCSGIRSTGNHNMYSNIVANHNGYEYNSEYEDEHNAFTCEWLVNTINGIYANCEIDNYVSPNDDRHKQKLPTYPVYYQAGALQNQKVYVFGVTNAIARKPIHSNNHISTSMLFDVDYTKIISGKGYEIVGTEGFNTVPFGYNTPSNSEVTFVTELLITDDSTKTFDKNIVLGYADYFMSITIRPDGTASGAIGKGSDATSSGNVTLGSINEDGVLTVAFDKTKPIRAGVSSKVSGIDIEGNVIYELTFGIWYFDTIQNGYVYKIARKTNISSSKVSTAITYSNLFNIPKGSESSERSDFYLRQVLVTDSPCILSDVTYPGNNFYGLNPIIGFDYESVNGNLKPFVGHSDKRPTFVYPGAMYFDVDLGKPLWAKTVDGSNVVWADANGIETTQGVEAYVVPMAQAAEQSGGQDENN